MTTQVKDDIKLSIIIPVYNTEKYLKKCIDSVLDATSSIDSYEIIVINDGSPGNADEIMNEYLNNNKLHYFINENRGIAATRNFGIERSSGKYVTFVDSDDYIDKDYYLESLKIIDKEKCDVVVCDFESCRSENDKFRTHAKNPHIDDDRWGCIDISIMPSPCNKIVKKELYDNLKYPVGLIYEDLATTLILLLKANKVVYIPKMFYKYNIRENSIMTSNFSEKKLQIIDILEILFSRIDVLDISKDDKNRAKSSVCYDRIYFELLEPLSQENFNIRYKLAKKICIKFNGIIKKLNRNNYYIKKLQSGRIMKRIYAKLVNFCLYNKLPLLVCIISNRASYYNNQYVDDLWRNN